MNHKEYTEEVNKLKTHPNLDVIVPIDLGSGHVHFIDYRHTCENMIKEEEDYEILGSAYSHSYSSWDRVYSIGNEKITHENKFILGDGVGFTYPREGTFFPNLLFCPFCGLNLVEDRAK